ncbi:hypothetical protein EDF46_1319 [Frondihabitans sp. PhB188]|nr:hypothetical protein EDF46_1319 [Frondihabitans sp. PhB188]
MPEKHHSSWRLPLDAYSSPLVNLAEQAENTLIEDCFRQDGRSLSFSRIDESTRPGESWNAAHRKLFNEPLASKYGYGNSFEYDLTIAEITRMRSLDEKIDRSVGAAADGLFDSCLDKSRAAIEGSSVSDPYQLAHSLAGVAYDDAYASVPVRHAADEWKLCMKAVGVPDLPDNPNEMPSPSIDALRPSGVDVVIAPGEETNVPPEERRVAVADAKCQVSSGYAAAAYDAEWDAQAAALSANADELERYKVEADKRVDRAKKILAEHSATR